MGNCIKWLRRMVPNASNRSGGYKKVNIVIIMRWKMKKAVATGFSDQDITTTKQHRNGFCTDFLPDVFILSIVNFFKIPCCIPNYKSPPTSVFFAGLLIPTKW